MLTDENECDECGTTAHLDSWTFPDDSTRQLCPTCSDDVLAELVSL